MKVNSTKKLIIRAYGKDDIVIPAGVSNMPNDLRDHWFIKAHFENGVLTAVVKIAPAAKKDEKDAKAKKDQDEKDAKAKKDQDEKDAKAKKDQDEKDKKGGK